MRAALPLLALVAASVAAPRFASAQPAIHSNGAASPRPAVAIVPTATVADTGTRLRLDIPAAPLGEALGDLARQASLRIRLDDRAPASVRSAAVHGTFTAVQALRALLEGTELVARFEDAGTVVVERAPRAESVASLGPVIVTAAATRSAAYGARHSVSATKTDLPLRDVPQAVSVVGSALLADQGMRSMADVARYLPGVTMGQGEGHRDAPTIRGNSSTADFFVDGVRDDAQYLRDLYNVERIEALKGSNAMIFGRGGGGGVINRVTKEAQWAPVRSLVLEGGSHDHKRAMLDIGQGAGRSLAGRVNGVYERSGIFRDQATIEREGINPTLALLAGGTLLRAGVEHFADRRTVDRGLPSYQGRPSSADISTFFGDPEASRSRVAATSVAASVERGSADGLLLRNRTRWARYDKFYRNVYPGAMSADGERVTLSAYDNATDRRNLFNQTDVTYAVVTGPARHTLLVGAELGRQTTANFRQTGYFDGTATSLSVPFADPTVSPAVTFRQSTSDADNGTRLALAGAYAQHQLSLGERWQTVVGVRYDRFDLRFTNHRDGRELRRDDAMLSPRAGLVFKPVVPVSLYATYSVSHLPSAGDQFSSLSATTETLEPERFDNREVGIKWEPRPDLALTAAAYRLDRTNTSAPDPVNAGRLVQTGRQRSTGVELGASGNVTDAWEIAAGYAVQRARIESATSAAKAGATVPLVPRQTASLWNRWDLASRLGAGLGVVHQADMYAAVDNTVTLPGFTRFDAALFFTVSPAIRAQLNVENLLDERYYATSHGNNNIMPGAPRTLRVSVTATP